MSSAIIINAAPMVIDRGTQDLSSVQLAREAEPIPQHVAKCYIFAKKGPTTPQLVVGVSRTQMYDEDTFDIRKKYANHATLFANLINAEGNATMLQRVIPEDAGPESNFLLSLDVLPIQIPLYERGTDGMITLDILGNSVPVAGNLTTPGYKAKWVMSSNATPIIPGVDNPNSLNNKFGTAAITAGDQVDVLTSTQSKRYPIFEVKASSRGSFGNDAGMRIWAPTINSAGGVSKKLMNERRCFPFNFAMIKRTDPTTTPKLVETTFGEQFLSLTLKPGVIDPVSDRQMYLGDVLLNSYQNLDDPKYPPLFNDLGAIAIYQNNIQTLSELFYIAELPFADSWTDFVLGSGIGASATATVSGGKVTLVNIVNGGTFYGKTPSVKITGGGSAAVGATAEAVVVEGVITEIRVIEQGSGYTVAPTVTIIDDENTASEYLFNFVSGQTSQGTPYYSYQLDSAANNSTRLSQYSNLYAKGGSDGTMNDAIHAKLVKEAVSEYLNPNSELHDIAQHVESIMYDSGFPLETKYALCGFIGERKDTCVVLSTHDVNERVLTASEEYSLTIALRTRLQMYPESDYYGTPVMRGMVIGGNGKLRNSQFTKRVPLSAEIAIKSARYMGASDGKWKNGKNFDGAPNSIIENLTDPSIKYVAPSVRNKNWDVGLNWVQRYDRRQFFFPALKTVYNDDTSVLNSFFTVMAIGQLNKVAHQAWREFSGISHLTDAQFVKRVNEYVNTRTQGRFDDRFIIEPKAYITDSDLQRGYSWTLPIDIYAAGMRTVMTTMVRAYRLNTYTGDSARA